MRNTTGWYRVALKNKNDSMNILSYNKKTTGEGWIELNSQYNADEIEMIADPDGGLTSTPRTAIPSPFAQMDLVKNAFRRLSAHADLRGEVMDEKLVANALDVAQLFFNYHELSHVLRIVEWNRQVEIDRLLANPAHKLLGETIAMYMEQDKEAFNFDRMDRLYFLVYGNQVVGSTSPVTLFMASPNARKGMYQIPVEQNVNLFDQWRPLWQRSADFVKYLYALFTAYPELKHLCGEVNGYLIRAFRLLPDSLQADILHDVGNPDAVNEADAERAKAYLQGNFDMLDEGVQALGVPVYCAREEDIQAAIQQSDFKIKPTHAPEGELLPLVLQNHLGATQGGNFRYITGNWDDSIEIRPMDYRDAPEKRTLPATSHQYPWLTDDDFLQPTMIKLDYTLNCDSFFDGNMSLASREVDEKDFLLPLKPAYFKYFDAKDLWGTIAGKPRFEMIHGKQGSMETVRVVLRIPVQKEGCYITLQRTYVESQNGELSFDAATGRGRFVNVACALGIFPFVRAQGSAQYNVQLVDRALGIWQNGSLSLAFHQDGKDAPLGDADVLLRHRSLKGDKRVGSSYYRVGADFDYISLALTDDRGSQAAVGIICPKWAEYVPGHDSFTFAVDFGTTNSHVESMRGDQMPEPLSLHSAGRNRLLATLYNGEQILYDVILKQEFLPHELGADYGFPQRTVLSESERTDADTIDTLVALGDANIPFIYEKESIGYGNRVVPNLKWSTEPATAKRVRAFLTELAQLMRAKVLLENGDLAKTRLVWFYPLSMKVGNVRKMEETWRKIFSEVFGVRATDANLIQMPESVAPYYYYKSSSLFRGAASTVASIDIGGGSSDVVVFESGAAQPCILTSFRFAANVLFGDGFSEVPQADSNPMLQKYVGYFKRLFDADDDKYGELNGILDDITARKKSEDVNAFLFSVIANKVVQQNEVFSYNQRLNEDGVRKIVFLYFYAAIIYYVAQMMHHRGVEKPRSVMFSGTGSKVLDIVGTQRDLDLFTQAIFERVYGERYDADGFSVVMERKEPKQITCRGALMQVRNHDSAMQAAQLNRLLDDFSSPLKYNYSMVAKERLTYADMDDTMVRQALVLKVKEFNDFFVLLCEDIRVTDRFLVDLRAFCQFKELVSKDLEHHLLNGWAFMNKDEEQKSGADDIEDTVFFYPIIGSIRHNLIQHLE